MQSIELKAQKHRVTNIIPTLKVKTQEHWAKDIVLALKKTSQNTLGTKIK